MAAARLKVIASLPAPLRDASARTAQRFHLDAPGWFQDADPPPLLTELAHAVWQDQTVVLRYRRREEVTRTVEPYGLVLKSGGWYLVGRVGGSERIYRVDRVVSVEAAGVRFTRDATFDLAAFWAKRADEFVRGMHTAEVSIRLSPLGLRALRFAVEPPSFEAAVANSGEPDGQGCVVTSLPVESIDVAFTQLYRLGPEAEVLAPQALRERIAAAAAAHAAVYAQR
jgi:predicted DNA-binding transcriptional regulator YafY